MEIKNYFMMIKRHKLMLFLIPAIAMAGAYFLVKYIPDSYVAKTQIVTGLVDQSQRVMNNNDNRRDENLGNEFINLIESIQLDRVINQVGYQLLLHDLTVKPTFRKMAAANFGLTKVQLLSTIALLEKKQLDYELLNPAIPTEHAADSLISAAGYDAGHLLKKNLKIFHSDGSDFISIECDTENPALSAFIVNQLSDKFINYYTANLSQGHNKSTEFLGKLLVEKQTAMRQKIAELESYKVKHNILDMANESKDAYDQLNSLEGYRQQANKDVIAYTGTLKSIDSRFDPKDRKYLESTTTKVNAAILVTRERLRVTNNKYLENNFDPKYKKSLDSLQNALTEEINQSTDKYISNPLAAKDNLVQEKLKMENNLEIARFSAGSLDKQIGALKGRLNGLVPAQAVVSSLDRDIDIATKEYLDVQDKYNQANVQNALPVQLRQLHAALPGIKQPSKKILLIALSGCVSFVLCMVIILALFYFDSHVRNRDDLERLTAIKVLGELNFVPEIPKSKARFKEQSDINGSMTLYRNLLRNIRFEIDSKLSDQITLGITSLNGLQGKTLFSLSLAYAYAISNKKVLLIDGNFIHPVITEMVKPKLFLEEFLHESEFDPDVFEANQPDKLLAGKKTHLLGIGNSTPIGSKIQRLGEQSSFVPDGLDRINIMGNRGGDVSLLEISSQKRVQEKLEQLQTVFDVIIIETGSLNSLSKTKEWMLFTDNTIGLFENNQSLRGDSKPSIDYLKGLNGRMMGWVLNKTNTNFQADAI
ncbi:exopolysaccharide transport family protein [Mucilaginibacter ginkgonis]|uniref:Lipopolysaccharide biosynthesis protein n=1 Tax=Mucilaginibacter ginkgonis TaxID=2682091 RepID=A0A6I4HWB9_9SPHI|nr:hypothetical protein [Mucilaginibacter ginkgonis]QQL51239.1 hypothetical protein GO620_007265 [Mucilaginibacter ginkgonis]